MVTCGLTACTPGSALGPTLGNEYGKAFTFYLYTNQRGYLAHESEPMVYYSMSNSLHYVTSEGEKPKISL